MDFVIIANAWQASVDNPTSKHQIALELARQGHRVLWVEGAGMRVPKISSGADRGRMAAKVKKGFSPASQVAENIWRIAPLVIPLPAFAAVRALNAGIYLRAIRRNMNVLGFENAVLVNFVPVVPGVLKSWRGRKVYYCVDRWDQFDMYDSALMSKLDEACCRNADLVIASAGDLYERCKKLNPNTHLITHGVDYEHFAKALQNSEDGRQKTDDREQKADKEISNIEYPMSKSQGNTQHSDTSEVQHPESCIPDPASGTPSPEHRTPNTEHTPRPAELPSGRIIGFFGLISEWVDQDLLVRLAAELPDAHVVLIGKADVPIDKLKAAANIHILGPRPFAELPTYVAHFDVGVIPFIVNDLTRAVNPIKFHEMMAAGCPVVSTELPEVAPYAGRDGIKTAGSVEDFIECVRNYLDHPTTSKQKLSLSESVKGETWQAKVREFLGYLNALGILNGQPAMDN
jgi:glycosyltransferase involved in cell wall biosynthesis